MQSSRTTAVCNDSLSLRKLYSRKTETSSQKSPLNPSFFPQLQRKYNHLLSLPIFLSSILFRERKNPRLGFPNSQSRASVRSVPRVSVAMYADRVVAGSKRSIKDRLNGNSGEDFVRSRQSANGKRQRQNDDKWKHDLYEDDEDPQVSNPKVGARDLRLKLQRKGSLQAHQSGKGSREGVRDLREKLAGTMHSQPANTDMPKAKVVAEAAKPVKKSVVSAEAIMSDSKKVANPASSRKKSQQKADTSVDGFLQSLGLEKYLITFQAEEVDMTALMHMTDEDLKALGIPMGPRKKIILALDSRD